MDITAEEDSSKDKDVGAAADIKDQGLSPGWHWPIRELQLIVSSSSALIAPPCLQRDEERALLKGPAEAQHTTPRPGHTVTRRLSQNSTFRKGRSQICADFSINPSISGHPMSLSRCLYIQFVLEFYQR